MDHPPTTKPYLFREEDKPPFRLRSAGLWAVLLLLLLFWWGGDRHLFQLSAAELKVLEEARLERERDMTFRFVDAPADDVEQEEAEFLSDADRIKKSQPEEQETPDNNDPISVGNTYELEQGVPQANESGGPPVPNVQPSPPTPPQPQRQQQLQEEPEEVTPEEAPPEPDREEPLEAETDETGQEAQEIPDVRGQVPTDPNAPKPFRRLSSQEMDQIREQAAREMTVSGISRPMSRVDSSYDNPRGSSAPVTGMSIETSRDDLGDYLKILKQLIRGNWRIPNIARFEVSGFAVVYFRIHQDGKFSDAILYTESGHEPLDTAALNAIINTYKAPPLPQHVDEEWIPIRFGFYYNMRPRY